MTDPATIAVVATATGTFCAGVGQELVKRVLGPAADYYGNNLKNFIETRGQENFLKILAKSERKLPKDKMASGVIPPQVLRDVLLDGSFCEDELTQEYYAGILATSKDEEVRDNRGVGMTSLIKRLSNYQVCCHFILYSAMNAVFQNNKINPNIIPELQRIRLYIPDSSLQESLQIKPETWDEYVPHIIWGMFHEELLDRISKGGKPSEIGLNVAESGWVVSPTPLGIQLYLWAQGKGKADPSLFFSEDFTSQIPLGITLCQGYKNADECK